MLLLSNSVECILNIHTHIACGMKVTYIEDPTRNGETKLAGLLNQGT